MSLLSTFSAARDFAKHLLGTDEVSRAERELASMNDQMLHDLGIARCEIHSAVEHGRGWDEGDPADRTKH